LSVLLPHLVDERFALPEEALVEYHRLSWDNMPEDTTYDLAVQPSWSGPAGGGSRTAFECVASSNGVQRAALLFVIRVRTEMPSWGTPYVPTPPVLAGDRDNVRTLVINRESCLSLLDRSGFDQRIARDEPTAWASGFPNILVPSTLLVTEIFSGVPLGASGVAEVWFHQPVPAGAVLTLETARSGQAVWLSAALPAHPHAAVTGRLSPSRATRSTFRE
jgi:hypothetical protein